MDRCTEIEIVNQMLADEAALDPLPPLTLATCPVCNGQGQEPAGGYGEDAGECSECFGHGWVPMPAAEAAARRGLAELVERCGSEVRS
jgi:hypothetical protein